MNYQPNYYNSNPYMSYFSPQQGMNPPNLQGSQQPVGYYYQQQQQMIPQQQQVVPQPQPQTQSQVQPMSTINGKIVDGKDIVRVTEVPMGGYGVFPKADLNEIYIKEYNLNGTTKITTYRPVPDQVVQPMEDMSQITTTELLEHLQKLEGKIDSIIERGSQIMIPISGPMQQLPAPAPQPIPSTPVIEQKQLQMPIEQASKKEVNLNAF